MRKLPVWILMLLAAFITTPAAAQLSGFCIAEFNAAVDSVAESCANTEIDELCYGQAEVTAIPRFLTAEFDFDESGKRLEIAGLETMTTEVVPVASYGMVTLNMSAGLENEDEGSVRGVIFGNTFTANNVLPPIQLTFTTNAAAELRREPNADSVIVAEVVETTEITASGRIGLEAEITEDTWVRVTFEDFTGWMPADVLVEDYLLLSLPVVGADEPTFSPLQDMTSTSVREDRSCEDVPDSGLILQTPAQTEMRINGLDMMLDSGTLFYVQAQPNATMDVYVLAGGVDAESTRIEGGTFMSYTLGPDAQIIGFAMSEPTAYNNSKVAPLILLADLFENDLMIEAGVDDEPSSVAAVIPEGINTPEVAIVGTAAPLEQSEIVQSEVVQAPTLQSEVVQAEVVQAPTVESEVVQSEVEQAPTLEFETAQIPTVESEIAEPIAANEVDPVVSADVISPPEQGDTNIATSPFAATLRDRGVIRLGVNGNLPTFSEVNDSGEYVGLEPALARELVRRLFGDTVTIEWVEVSARQRSSALADGNIDILIRNTGFAPERSTWGEWTDQFYFVDGQRVLVRADSGITTSDDLVGRAIAVQAGTNAETTLDATAATTGVTVVPQQGTLVELVTDLESGFVDGISSDWTALEAIRQASDNPDDFIVVGELLTSVPWNIATPPGEIGLRDDIQFALTAIIDDGTWASIYDLTFGQPLPPSLQDAFATGGADVVVAAAPVAAEEVAPPVESNDSVAVDSPPVVPTTPPETDIPITGEVTVTIFTNPSQQRILRITPDFDGTFTVELIRLGEIVYTGRFDFYESSGRYENIRNSFEFISFSDTAGDTSLGCDRLPDMSGEINGAPFEVKVGC